MAGDSHDVGLELRNADAVAVAVDDRGQVASRGEAGADPDVTAAAFAALDRVTAAVAEACKGAAPMAAAALQ